MRSAMRLKVRSCARVVFPAAFLAVAGLGHAGFEPPSALATGADGSMAVVAARAVDAGAGVEAVGSWSRGGLPFAGPLARQVSEPPSSGADAAGALTASSASVTCSADAPIKAMTTEEGERLFYVPADPIHEAIVPERCFATEGAAVAGGYRLSAR